MRSKSLAQLWNCIRRRGIECLWNRRSFAFESHLVDLTPLAGLPNIRKYAPPGTSRLVQQLSRPDPQSLRPGPPPWQLVPGVELPVHIPLPHVPAAHGQGMPHCPITSQVCTAEAPVHCETPGVQPPASPPLLDAELLPAELPLPLELPEIDPELPLPPLLLLGVIAPELVDVELPLDPELPPPSLAPLSSTLGTSRESRTRPQAAAPSGETSVRRRRTCRINLSPPWSGKRRKSDDSL